MESIGIIPLIYSRSKNKIRYCFLALLTLGLLLSSHLANAQLSTNEPPISLKRNLALNENIDVKKTSGLSDMKKIIEEDRQDSIYNTPPRFGYKLEVNWNTENSGTWEELPDGGKLWRLKIVSPGALSINLLYDKFWLPDSAKLFIYNEKKSQVFGAFTSLNNKGSKENPEKFATTLIFGDTTILEYYQPSGVTEKPVISISFVVHGYKHITIGNEISPLGFGSSLPCNININCPEGSQFQVEKRAVALIVVNGNRICTGSLINNTSNNMAPYFLTANHCLGSYDAVTNPNLPYWSFLWNYESPDCSNPAISPPFFTTIGATIVANYQNTDMALFMLTEDPKNLTNYNPTWVGWNRNTTSPTAGTGIHHPEGDIKKISRSFQTVISNSDPIDWPNAPTSPANSHWVVNYTQGTMQPGSSGSFLLNQDKLIVGQLHGGYEGCPPVIQYYGKFDRSWTGGTAAQRRLRDWLDPISTGLAILNTKVRNINGPKILCSGSQTYTLESPPAGATITWSLTGSGVFTVSGSGATATVTKVGDGGSYLQAKIGTFILAEKFITTLTSASVQTTKYGNCNSGGWQEWFLEGDSDNGTSNWHWFTDVLPPNVQVNIYSPNSPSTWVSIKGGGGVVKLSFTDNCGRPQTGGVTIYAACQFASLFQAVYNEDSQSIDIKMHDDVDPNDYLNETYIKSIRLFAPNGKGVIVDQSYQEGTLQQTIDVPELESGRYLLEVIIGDLKEMVPIEIE